MYVINVAIENKNLIQLSDASVNTNVVEWQSSISPPSTGLIEPMVIPHRNIQEEWNTGPYSGKERKHTNDVNPDKISQMRTQNSSSSEESKGERSKTYSRDLLSLKTFSAISKKR